jgi:hypothetical protein
VSTHIPGDDHEREPVATSGTADHPHAHLNPVVEAELSWGNEVAEDWHVTDPHFGYWGLTPARPFHVDALRERFRFPASVRLRVVAGGPGGQKPSMFLGDRVAFVGITAPLPGDWPHGEGEVAL